jgi:hypothetical protein
MAKTKKEKKEAPAPEPETKGEENAPGLLDGFKDGEKKEPVPQDWTPKGNGQHTLEGEEVPKATIYIKPAGVPYEIRTEKFKLNTTEEGFNNRKDAESADLRQWVVKKLKVLKDAVICPGDFDQHTTIVMDVITGKIEAPVKHVGEDD